MQNPEDLIAGLMMLGWFVGVHIGMAGVFRKAGIPAWQAFIPFLNGYQICVAARISPLWMVAIFVPLVNLGFLLYLGIQLSRRFGYSEWFGVLLGFSGLGLLPIVAFSGRESLSKSETEQRLLLTTPDAIEADHVLVRRSTFGVLLVVSMLQLVCLLCVPGLMIVGAMAFDGANSITPAMELSIGLAALIPLSLLSALAAQWAFYAAKRYKLAISMTAMPVLNALALVCSVLFGWAGR